MSSGNSNDDIADDVSGPLNQSNRTDLNKVPDDYVRARSRYKPHPYHPNLQIPAHPRHRANRRRSHLWRCDVRPKRLAAAVHNCKSINPLTHHPSSALSDLLPGESHRQRAVRAYSSRNAEHRSLRVRAYPQRYQSVGHQTAQQWFPRGLLCGAWSGGRKGWRSLAAVC